MKRTLPFPVFLIMITLMNCSNKPQTLVCLGNSLTAGHGAVIPQIDDREKSFPAYLQKKIKNSVINAGVSGDTTAQGLSRVKNEVLKADPGIVIIELGANDLFQRIPLSDTRENLQNIINLINDGKRKIYLVRFYTESIAREWITMFQINDYDEQTTIINQYNEMFTTLAKNNNIELIEDIWEGVWGVHMSDEVHPNAKGYEAIAENIFKIMKPYLLKNKLLANQ